MSELHAWDVQTMDASVCKTPADDELFRELAGVLKKHNALNRFGITLLHKHFDISPDEALLETTDVMRRCQLLQTVKRSELIDRDAVETAWRLGPSGEALWGCVCSTDRNGNHMGHRTTQ
jgi:hypothetical protein